MGTLIVRNVDEELIERLKARASRNGRSMEAEHREVLRDVLAAERLGEVRQRLSSLRQATAGRPQTPSEDLLREDREGR